MTMKPTGLKTCEKCGFNRTAEGLKQMQSEFKTGTKPVERPPCSNPSCKNTIQQHWIDAGKSTEGTAPLVPLLRACSRCKKARYCRCVVLLLFALDTIS